MKTKFKLFEAIENYEVLATNSSNQSWNDDSDYRLAQILLDKNNGSLYLKIRRTKSKSGIGSGQWSNDLEFVKIGNLEKADLAKVRTLLKKYSHERSRSSSGFSKFWEDEEGNKMNLGDLLDTLKPAKVETPAKVEKIKKELKYIKPISTFKKEVEKVKKDIELVEYSQLSHAIFGEGTRAIKDELVKIGCKYNKFLTDPKTGNKRAGWICSNKVLDKVKKLL